MKKIALVLVIFSLILFTAIIKNSAKKNEDKLFTVKENIRILNSELEKIKLEFDYLSSSDKEISENSPSRSAKLRYAIKKNDFYDFKTDILDQFSSLMEIENFGNKLWKKLL